NISVRLRKRASLSRSDCSICLRCRNWPTWLPMTRAACSSLWSGSRTDSPEKASTPMLLPSDVTAKVSTPRVPAPSATDFVDARMSRWRSPDQAGEAAGGAAARLAADAGVGNSPLRRRAAHERVREGPAGVKQRAMRVPSALDFEAALPAAQADQAPLQILVAARDVPAFEAGKAVAGVGFPVPVRGQVGEATPARGALAVCLLRRRLPHESADAAAEPPHPVRQALVGRTHRAAAEAQHADDFRARAQRDQQRGAQAHLLEQLVAYALGPGRLQIVADPPRFSRLPHGAHHPLAPLDSALARSFDHGRGTLGVQRAPVLVKAQRAAGFFHL